MASTYTSLLRTEQQASGENSNTWGTKANVVFVLTEEAIAGMEVVAITGGSYSLTSLDGVSDEARNAIIKFTGTLTSNQTIVVPNSSKHWIFWNATTGNFTLTVKTAAGTGVVITQGAKGFLFCDATNVYEVISEIAKQGKQTIFIPAQAMTPAPTNGCGTLAHVEVSAGAVSFSCLAFDKDAIEYAEFIIPLPKSWNAGTVSFKPYWTASDVTTNSVIWGLQAVSIGDGEALGATYGTAQTVTDANQSATYRTLIGPESSAITLDGTPANTELQAFRVYRKATDAGDTLAADALLLGIHLFITTNAANDA